MSHSAPRAAFGVAVLFAVVTLAMAVVVTLQPKPVALARASDVAIANFDALPEGAPQEFVVAQLRGLDLLARHLRLAPFATPGVPVMGERATREGDLHIFLVRTDGEVRGFIGLDPRNSCALEVSKMSRDSRVPPSIPVFHDVCHGSLYDIYGNKVGGPTPWTLDQIVISVHDGRVYAKLDEVLPGHLVR